MNKNYYPKFYYTAKCLAGACPDTCCAGWEIPLTESDLIFLRNYKSKALAPSDFLTVDVDGNACFKQTEGKCPFLNGRGLCKIRLTSSWENTPEVCRQHPLFIEEYDGFTENCPSLSCPAVSRDIFCNKTANDIYPSPKGSTDDEILNILIVSRDYLLNTVSDGNHSVREIINCLFSVSESAEASETAAEFAGTADNNGTTTDEVLSFERILSLVPSFVACMQNDCEILTENWKNMLQNSNGKVVSVADIENLSPEITSLTMYLVYRYWLKAINTGDLTGTAAFAAFSVLSCACISLTSGVDFSETSRLFSKEIEHDTDNLDVLFDAASNLSETII